MQIINLVMVEPPARQTYKAGTEQSRKSNILILQPVFHWQYKVSSRWCLGGKLG